MPPDDDSSQRIKTLESKIVEIEGALQRAAVQQALLDARVVTLERNLLFRVWNQVYRKAAGWYAQLGSGERYGGVSELRTPGDYTRFLNREEQVVVAGEGHARFSIVIEDGSNADTLASLKAQYYTNWELVESGAGNGDYVIVLHAGDRLPPHALYFYAQALAHESPAVVYADEDCNRTDPLFKPGWSPELFETTMYLGRAIAWRRDVSRTNPAMWDRVVHIPRVLYHRASSAVIEQRVRRFTAPADARLAVIICSREVRQVRECLDALQKTASVALEIVVVQHLESGDGEEMRKSVERFGGTCLMYRGPFDFARMNNLAASKTTASALLFLNDDVIVGERGWDEAFAATLTRPEIGVVGAMLQYPDGTVQHAGVVTGMGDGAGHCGRFQMSSELWPWLRMSRDVSAVTGAMLGIRSDLFRELGGFDEAFPVNYNDVDLCLRVRDKGLRVVCLDTGKIVHRESQTRIGGTRYQERDALYKRWGRVLARPDEFYSPHLAASERIALRTDESPLVGLVATR
jgi:GT2 family glycosyltransferase